MKALEKKIAPANESDNLSNALAVRSGRPGGGMTDRGSASISNESRHAGLQTARRMTATWGN